MRRTTGGETRIVNGQLMGAHNDDDDRVPEMLGRRKSWTQRFLVIKSQRYIRTPWYKRCDLKHTGYDQTITGGTIIDNAQRAHGRTLKQLGRGLSGSLGKSYSQDLKLYTIASDIQYQYVGIGNTHCKTTPLSTCKQGPNYSLYMKIFSHGAYWMEKLISGTDKVSSYGDMVVDISSAYMQFEPIRRYNTHGLQFNVDRLSGDEFVNLWNYPTGWRGIQWATVLEECIST